MLSMASVTAWKFHKTSYDVIEFKNYDMYTDFEREYILPLVGSSNTYIAVIKLLNNTSNSRAAIWHVDYVSKGTKKIDEGERVGGNFSSQYGGNIYAGATIEIYISEDIPELMQKGADV